MELNQSKVYIKVDENSRIIRCDGGYTVGNIENIEEWIFIDEGVGDKYNLCQIHYFDRLYTEDGISEYKWDGEKVILRSDAEIEADRENLPKPAPTEDELQWQDITELEISLMEQEQALTEIEIAQMEGSITA